MNTRSNSTNRMILPLIARGNAMTVDRLRPLVTGLLTAALFALAVVADAGAQNNPRSVHAQPQRPKSSGKGPSKPGDEKPMSEMTKGKTSYKGYFTLYHDTTDNSLLLQINKNQFDTMFILAETRSGGDGFFAESGLMNNTAPVYFKRVGKTVMLLEKNLRFIADSNSTAANGAVQNAASDGLLASTTVKSQPDSNGAILVDAMPLFVRDAENLNFFIGQAGQTGVGFDRGASYVEAVKSFPMNSEITVRLAYKTSRPMSGDALQNPYSFYHTYQWSLIEMTKTDYVPRLADDRVGNYMTMFQDYSDIKKESPYVRYINRWNLKKKNPEARISEPVKPVVYWIENTWPMEYRAAVAAGIEYWNQSLSKLGYSNAVVARQMPDTADWDPSDIRYSVVRYQIMKNNPYAAIGPHRANPLTGEVLDADIGFNADVIRGLGLQYQRRQSKVNFEGMVIDEPQVPKIGHRAGQEHFKCEMAEAGSEMAAFALNSALISIDDPAKKEEMTKEFINQFLKFVIAHEVGHTLTLRHNFAASTLLPVSKVNDPSYTANNFTLGSVMDYPAPNVAVPGETQGAFYGYVAGPYDDWVMEYMYSDFGAKTPEEEHEKLQAIADRAAEPMLAYATDEDCFGNGPKGINPYVNHWDMTSDPIEYYERAMKLSRSIWKNKMSEFETPGARYPEYTLAFSQNIQPFAQGATVVPRFVGGMRTNRYHVGDSKSGDLPFDPIPAAMQKRAIAFLRDQIWAADAFDISAEVLNKLSPEQWQDFQWTAGDIPQVDYNIHGVAMNIQNITLAQLYNPLLLGRLVNIARRYSPNEEKYTIYDMFTDVRKGIWSELDANKSINSFRRQLQMAHLTRLTNIYLSAPGQFPLDARTLAGNDLREIKSAASRLIGGTAVDEMSRAHLRAVVHLIEAAESASLSYN